MMTMIITMITMMVMMTIKMTITSSFLLFLPILHTIFLVSAMVLDIKISTTATSLFFFDDFVLLNQMIDHRGGVMCWDTF